MTTTSVENTDLVKRTDQALAKAEAPAYLDKYKGDRRGSEGVEMDDLLIPRLQVAQDGMTPQLKRTSENFNPDLKAGDLFNSVTGEIYGDSATVIPLFFFKNFIKFKPMADGGGVVAMYDKTADVPKEDLVWKDGKPPAVTEFKNRMCLIADRDGQPTPIVVSFKSTGIKAAKQWNNQILDTGRPAFMRQYKLYSEVKRKGEMAWFVVKTTPLEFVPEGAVALMEAEFNRLQAGGYKVDTSGIEEEATAPTESAF